MLNIAKAKNPIVYTKCKEEIKSNDWYWKGYSLTDIGNVRYYKDRAEHTNCKDTVHKRV